MVVFLFGLLLYRCLHVLYNFFLASPSFRLVSLYLFSLNLFFHFFDTYVAQPVSASMTRPVCALAFYLVYCIVFRIN
ncbi:MAG: hypothetical protein J3Q66DRAFT_61902 [Benniella sp.]|nr:MAG: hypothetical protein J3Q66DRAFT_61902 [Benniella sp.]